MRTYRRLCVQLTQREPWRKIDGVLSGGIQPTRVVLRALVLTQYTMANLFPKWRQCAIGIRKPCTTSGSATRTGIWIARYMTSNVQERPSCWTKARSSGSLPWFAALHREGALDGRCGWWPRKVIKRKLVPKVGRETIRVLLLHHDLKPWREKMWCVAELDEEYIAKMEDVLKTYEKPYNRKNLWSAWMRSR